MGKIDGGVLGTVFSTYMKNGACRKFRLKGGSSLFDDSISNKLNEILIRFSIASFGRRGKGQGGVSRSS